MLQHNRLQRQDTYLASINKSSLFRLYDNRLLYVNADSKPSILVVLSFSRTEIAANFPHQEFAILDRLVDLR
jgi:hypothetical protein